MQLQEFSFVLMGILILIILYILIGKYLEHRHIHFIHETGIGIIIGLIFGFIMYLTQDIKSVSFDEQVFFYGLLPPMIFAGGYNLKKQDFEKNFKYIFLFGFFGTIIAFGTIFGLTYLIDNLHWIIPVGESAQYEYMSVSLIVKYSATISASDSVAALTLISSVHQPKLFSIIFGQGMVNDAVAIILFKVVGDIVQNITQPDVDMSAGEITIQIVGKLLLTIFSSLGIGAACAIICSFLFKNFRFLVHNEITQVGVTYLFGILSYVVAQTLNMSGVITVLVCGILLAHYNYYNLTPGGMHATTVTFQFVAFLAEAVVFVYLGLSIIYYYSQQVFSITFIAAELVICFFARFVSIFGLSLIFRLFMKWKVGNNQLAVVCAAGTIRGSVALALILSLDQTDKNRSQVSIIKSTVLIMVCITTIVLGGIMPKLIKVFMGDKTKQSAQTAISASELTNPQKEAKKDRGLLKIFQNKYMKKWLIFDYANRRETIKMYKKVLKSNNSEMDKKDSNRLFILREMEMDIHRQSMQRGNNSIIQRQRIRSRAQEQSLISIEYK